GTEFSAVSIDLSDKCIVLVKPAVNIATAGAYQRIVPRPVKEDLREVLRFPIQDWKFYIKNDFEESVFESYPIVRESKLALYDRVAIYATRNGSGSAVYGIFSKPIDLTTLSELGLVCYPI